jgi:hypothetical protein
MENNGVVKAAETRKSDMLLWMKSGVDEKRDVAR